MAEATDIPAWIALLFAVYALGAAIGELVRPGSWAAMLGDFASSQALRFLTGIVCIAIGGAVYLAVPAWGGDWLAVLVKVMGGGMVIEGFVILAFGDRFMQLASAMLGAVNRLWALFSLGIGIVLAAVALARI